MDVHACPQGDLWACVKLWGGSVVCLLCVRQGYDLIMSLCVKVSLAAICKYRLDFDF